MLLLYCADSCFIAVKSCRVFVKEDKEEGNKRETNITQV